MLSEDPNGVIYIAADDATTFLAQHVGSRYQARLLIADAMHTGELITTADAVWTVNDIDPTDDWESIVVGAELIAEDVELPEDFWVASGRWPEETRHWRWKNGNFLLNAAVSPEDPFHGDAVSNVHFLFQQVQDLIGQRSRMGVGGRPPDRTKWALFWIDIMRRTSDGGFDWGQFATKHQLKLFMLRGNNEDRFAESNVDLAVEAAWTELVEPHRRERLKF